MEQRVLNTFIQYLIEARYAVDHPLVADIKKSIANDVDGQERFEVDNANIKEISSTLVRAFGPPNETREETPGQMGELFWDFKDSDYTMYYLWTDGRHQTSNQPSDDVPSNVVYVEKVTP